MAITWRNVSGSGSAAMASVGSRLLEQSGNSINAGVEGIKGIFAEQFAREKADWERGKENNTNTLLDKLASYKTPEELAAAEQSGEIQALRSQFGQQIDSAAIRDAQGGLEQKLIERISAQNQYADDSLDRTQRGDVDAIKGMIAKRDFTGADAALERLELRNEAPLFEALQQGQRNQVEEGYQDRRFNMDDKKFGAEMSGIGLRNSAAQLQLTSQQEQQGMSAMVAQVLQNYPTEQAGREALLQMARDQGVSGKAVLAGVTELSGLYGAATGLTKEDQDELAKRQTSSQASLERFNQDEKTALDKVIKNAPVEPVYSFSDKDRMTEGQVYEQIAKVIPKNREETVKTIQDKVSNLSGKYKVPAGMELGPVIQEAFKRTGTTGEDGAWFSLDADVDSSVFEKNFNEVLGAAIKSFNNQTIVDKAQAEYTRKVREKEDEEIRNLSQYKNSRTDTYKFRKDIQKR